MNFDFLKGLCGLGDIYEDCTNAEKLAVSMPVQSLFTARRSAEQLAKFIYMTAHKERMEDMSFMDILSDEAFRRFIKNRDVMDAFHYIRKNGNRAVHGDSQETPEHAIDVLQDLHFVAGETACILGLINSYPQFDSDVKEYTGKVIITEDDINQKAMEMFLEYANQYDAEKERENYYCPSDEEFFEYMIEGIVDLHEYLVFDHQPKHVAVIEYLQEYLLLLYRFSVMRAPDIAEELDLLDPVTVDIKIQINGEKTYSSSDVAGFLQAVREELPNANSLIIDCRCKGNLREIYYDDENDTEGKLHKDRIWDGSGMLNKLESFKRRERFSYYKLQFYPNSGCITAAAIINGKSKDIQDLLSEDILSKPDLELDSDGFMIYVDGEKPLPEYPELYEAFKRIVRESVYEDQLHFCEEKWDPDDLDYEEDCIIPCVQTKGFSIADYQSFLDKLNLCLEPWKDELEFWIPEPSLEDSMFGTSANILYDLDNLVLAILDINGGKLGLVGTVFETL